MNWFIKALKSLYQKRNESSELIETHSKPQIRIKPDRTKSIKARIEKKEKRNKHLIPKQKTIRN